MKVTIVGAGAIGALMGASMIKAGIDVAFVEKDRERVDAMNGRGLTIHTAAGDWNVPAKAIEPSQYDRIAPLGIVYLATKSQHTEEAIYAMKPFLIDDSVVVSMQNGFNEELILGIIGAHRTIGAFVNYGGASVEPGEMEKSGEGTLYIGELDGKITSRLRLIQSQCANFCPTFMTDNIMGYLWSKEAMASAIIFTSLADSGISEGYETEENQRVCTALSGEAIRVAEAAGVKLENFSSFDPLMYLPETPQETAACLATWQANQRRNAELAAQKPHMTSYKFQKKGSGVWWDINVRKRKTETDWLVGAVAKKGEEMGVDVSLTRELLKMINEIEEGKRSVSKDNWKEMYQKMRELGKDLP